MALLRSAQLLRHRNVTQHSFQYLSMRSLAISSDPEKSAQKMGYLEQLSRQLLPEVFQFQDKKVQQPSWSKLNKAMDDRDRDFKRTLVREATVKIREQVISAYSSSGVRANPHPPQLVVLDGLKGVGKSSILEQTVAFARLKGYVVLYIPNPEDWTRGRGFFAATPIDGGDPLMQGVQAVRFYDRPSQMNQIFSSLLERHEQQLAQIPCRPEFEHETSSGCETLLDLVKLGHGLVQDIDSNWRENPKLAGNVFNRLVNELCVCDRTPVAIVIDNFEHFVGMTCMNNAKKERVHANGIRAIADHFGRDSIENTAADMVNGFVMLATDDSHNFEKWRASRLRSGADYPLDEPTRRDPSGREWISAFKSRVDDNSSQMLIQVPELSKSELKTLVSTFVPGGFRRMMDGDHREVEVERLVSLAGGRADVMQKIAKSR